MADCDTEWNSDEYEYPYRDPAVLRELYWDRGLSAAKVADELDCSENAVLTWMKKNEIERRTQLNERPPRFHTDPYGYERWRHAYEGDRNAVRVHRLLAVSEYGLDAVQGRDVHHLNHIPWDNRPENIEIVDHTDHGEMHAAIQHGETDA